MKNKIGIISIMLIASVLIFFGCGKPYEKLTLSLDKTNIVLYVGNDDAVSGNEAEKRFEAVTATVSGASKGVSTDVSYQQIGNDVVDITAEVGSGGKTKLTLFAKYPGKSVIRVKSNEGQKQQDINVIVYKKIESVSFTTNKFAVKVNSSCDLNEFVNFTPSDTNQKDMDYYIVDESPLEPIYDGNGRLIETKYAKIVNGELFAKPEAGFPIDDNANDAIRVVGISKHNAAITTGNFYVPVVFIINESEIKLFSNSETSSFVLNKNERGEYEIVLASNNLEDSYFYKRYLTFNLGSYIIDKNYKITSSKRGTPITLDSKVELIDLVDDADRINYDPYTSGGQYPYKKFEVQQLRNGTEAIVFKIDHIGFEGLFTIEVRVKIVVKEVPKTIETFNQDGNKILNETTDKLEVFNTYEENIAGTFVKYIANPDSSPLQYSFSVKNLPTGYESSVMLFDKYRQQVNLDTKYDYINHSDINTIYFKHNMDSIGINKINKDKLPFVVITFYYSLNPSVTQNADYKIFEISKNITLNLRIGLNKDSYTVYNNIKVNVATGKSVNDRGEVFSPIILAKTAEQVDLSESLKSIKLLTVNGMPISQMPDYQPSKFNVMNNSLFSLEYITDEESNGLFRTLIIVPNTNGNASTIKLEITTLNGFVRTSDINFFAPLPYTTGDSVHVEIPSVENNMGSIFEYKTTPYKFEIVDGNLVITASEFTNGLGYNTLSSLALTTNARIPINVNNYIIVNGSLKAINNNFNVSIGAPFNYFTIESVIENGAKQFYLVTKSVESKTDQYVNVIVQGHDSIGNSVSFTHSIRVRIYKRIESINLSPASATIYETSSLGSTDKSNGTVKINVTCQPTVDFTQSGTTLNFRLLDEIVYQHQDTSGIITTFYTGDFITLNEQTGVFVAKLSDEANAKMNAITNLRYDDILAKLYQNPISVKYYAYVQQFNKEPIIKMGNIYIRYAKKVENIIPSVSEDGLYFDNYHEDSSKLKAMSFKVNPTDAFNTKLIARIKNENVAKIISGIDENGFINNVNNEIKIQGLNAGTTTIIVGTADSLVESGTSGAYVPSMYVEIRIKVADGSELNPFEIRTAQDFLQIGSDIKKGQNKFHYVLANNIDLGSYNFEPFGKFEGGLNGQFQYENTGVFYSVQNSIYGLQIARNLNVEDNEVGNYSDLNFGLFSQLGTNAKIKNLNIEKANIEINLKDNTAAEKKYTGSLNVGLIAGLSEGSINNSQASGNITVNSNANNVNVGGFVGKLNTIYSYKENGGNSAPNIIFTGYIHGLPPTTSDFNENNVNSAVTISLTSPKELRDNSNKNLGGVVGYAVTTTSNSQTDNSFSNINDVNINQIYNRDAVIKNVNTSVVITSYYDETGLLNNANIGGVVGKTLGTYLDTITLSGVLVGYSNIGGAVGFAENTYLNKIINEFANSGKAGINTANIVGHTNLGGLVGVGKNITIQYSYVRSYYNNIAIDNANYAGNIVLQSDGSLKNVYVGGLIGYVYNKNIHSQLTKKDPADLTNIINSTYKNGIFNSYFNADINTNFVEGTETVFAGGLVGGNESETDEENKERNTSSLIVYDSYVYGTIKVKETEVSASVVTELTDEVEFGTVIDYNIVNNRLEKTTTTIYEEDDIASSATKNYQAVVTEVKYLYGMFVGNEEFSITKTENIKSIKYVLDGNELVDTTDENGVAISINDQINKIVNGMLITTETISYEYDIKTNLKLNNTICSSFSTLNKSECEGLFEFINDINETGINTKLKNMKVHAISFENIKTTTKEYNEGVVISTLVETNTNTNLVNQFKKDNLKDFATYEALNYKIVNANSEVFTSNGNEAWAIYSGFNNGYPVLFEFDSTQNILFKLLPSEIEANILDFKLPNFNNRSYIKDAENRLVLFYNANPSSRSPEYMNKYLIKKVGDATTASKGVTVIEVDLNLNFNSSLPIKPNLDTNLIITSSSAIIKILNGGEIQTSGTGLCTLTISSKLDKSIYDEVEVLVVNGVSDFSLYYNKNTQDPYNKITNGNTLEQYIDAVNSYSLDVENLLKENYFTNYTKNSNVGVKIVVEEISGGADATNKVGTIELNNKQLVVGKTYLYQSIGEFNIKGKSEGKLKLTLTPFIKTGNNGFGETLSENLLENDNVTIDNCILIPLLEKFYEFNVLAKAESISTNNKSGASISPTGKDDVTVSMVTSNFMKNNEDYIIQDNIRIKIYNSKTGVIISTFDLSDTGEGNNNSFLTLTILGIDITPILNEFGEVLKVKVDYRLRFNFDTEKYKLRNSGLNYNLNEQNFRIVFNPISNPILSDEYNLNIVPTKVNSIEANFYANGEYSGSGTEGAFNPQEQSTDYIAPGRTGLLKFNVFPEFNNAEYVEIGVTEQYKSLVGLSQNIAKMKNGETSTVSGYEMLYENPQYSPEGKLILQNKSLNVNDDVIFNGSYYLRVMLDKNAPENQTLTFTINACRTVNGTKEIVYSYDLNLKVQPLPNVYLSIDGSDNGVVAVGTEKKLDIQTINVTNLSFDISSNNAYLTYDEATNNLKLIISNNAQFGEIITITAKGSAVLNGTLEQSLSTIRVKVVPFVINGFELAGGVLNGNRYNMEILNGTTNSLGARAKVNYNENLTDVANRLSLFNSLISGNTEVSTNNYFNNWYKYNSNVASGTSNYELLSINNNYLDYEFVDVTEPGLGSMIAYHYYGIKSLKIPSASANHTLAFKMKFYYDVNGNPQKYDDILSTSESYFEYECLVNLIIKDNSTYDHPNPIETKAEFMQLESATDGHYILINDITLDNYAPFPANFKSLDGNGYTIKLKNFNMSKYKNAATVTTGMFETISANTVLKNITIDISGLLITQAECNAFIDQKNVNDESYQNKAKINLAFISNVNFGILAGSNSGSVTNCKIVNLSESDKNNQFLYVNTTQGYLNGSQTQALVAGLVATNSGSISNSFIGKNMGGASFSDTTSGRTVGSMEVAMRLSDAATSDAQINIVNTYPFMLAGGKTIAAVVGNNSGIIANTYNKEVGVVNVSNRTFAGSKTSGFVLNNSTSGNIFNSFVEGANVKDFRADGSIYIEGIGYIGGFVYENAGTIKNAYSNIKISTNSGGSGGFVYTNLASGVIINTYTTANNAFNSKAHGQFTGLDSTGTINNFGSLQSCFYLVFESEIANVDEPATPISGKRSSDKDDKSNPFRYQGSFNGFSFASGNESNNIWKMSDSLSYGPQLVSCINTPTFSFRKLLNVPDSGSGEVVYNYEYNTNFKYGSTKNPLLVNSSKDFINFIINNSKTVRNNSGQSEQIFGIRDNTPGVDAKFNIRLINNLDFNDIDLSETKVDGKIINDIVFVGELDGNGMKMMGVEINNTKKQIENFGLFKQVGLSDQQLGVMGFNIKSENVKTTIKNLTMSIGNFISNDAAKVGALAGSIYNTTLINTEIIGERNVVISGKNLVGGYAGLIINNASNALIDVRTNNISVIANHRSNTTAVANTSVDEFGAPYTEIGTDRIRYESYETYRDTQNPSLGDTIINKLSYAGSIAGVLVGQNRDVANRFQNMSQSKNGDSVAPEKSTTSSNNEAINAHRTSPTDNAISSLKSYGGGIVQAEQAGGLFGYVSENTHIKNSCYIVGLDDISGETIAVEQRIIGYHYAGGIVGENYGFLEQVYIENSPKKQAEIDKNITSGKVAGPDNLFESTNNVVGGNVGETAYPIAIGGLVGFTDRSIILDSYSKINVINTQAKIAGGVVGLATRESYLSHVVTTGDVFAKNVIGGAIGLYNQTGAYVVTNRITGTYLKTETKTDKISDLNSDIYKLTANGDYYLNIKNGSSYITNYYYDVSDQLVKNENGESVIYVDGYKLGEEGLIAFEKHTVSDNNYLKVKDEYKTSIISTKGNRDKYCVKITNNQKLNLDYVFALNTWGEKPKLSLINNLNKYYEKAGSTGIVAYYNYTLRMPEVGNQAPTIKGANANNASDYKTLGVSIGSVLGKLKVSDKRNSADDNVIIGTGLVKNENVSYNQEGVRNEASYSKAALLTSRLVKVLNKSDDTGRGTVISTTFASAKLSNGIDGTKYNPEDKGYVNDYTDFVPNENEPNKVGDYIKYNNHLGSQFQLTSIYGTDNVNSNMLGMFKLDSEVKPEKQTEENATSLEALFSQTWKLQDDGFLPEYIIGIYSNFNKIETYADLVNLSVNRNTKNQFYVLAKNKDEESGDYVISTNQEEGVRNYFFRSDFEGTLIGEPFLNNENKLQNPKIITSHVNKAVFNNIKTATIQNVDFDIQPIGTSTTSGTKLVQGISGVSAGLFANNITSSIMSNVNFTVGAEGKNYTISINNGNTSLKLENFGLVFGSATDSSFNSMKISVKGTAPSGNYNGGVNGVSIETDSDIKNIGMLTGLSNRCNYSNVQSELLLSGNSSKNGSINVNINKGNPLVASETNVGGVFGNITGNTMVDSVNKNLDENGNFNKDILNMQLRLVKTRDSSYVNFGGVFGKTTNGMLNNINYYANTFVGYVNDDNTKAVTNVEGAVNVGGIVGFADNSTLETVQVNANITKTNENFAFTKIDYKMKINTNGVLVAGGIAGLANNTKIIGSSTSKFNTINSSDIIIAMENKNTTLGGIVGKFDTTSADMGISYAINTGTINVLHKGDQSATSSTLLLGGIAGAMNGGKTDQVINYGELNITTNLKYNIGGIVGIATNNKSVNVIINNYINYGDIKLVDEVDEKGIKTTKPSNENIISGVVGNCNSTGIAISNGYTVGRIYGCPNISKFLKGIAYGYSPSDNTNKNYFVEEFNPYSTIVLDESVGYGDLSSKLAELTSGAGISFETKAETGTTKFNLPKLKNMIDTETIDVEYGKKLFGTGNKLNPIYLSTNGIAIGAGQEINKLNKHYIIEANVNPSITIVGEFTGVLIGQKNQSTYPTIGDASGKPLVGKNSGIIANLQVNADKYNKIYENIETSSKNYGFLVVENTINGVILNCVSYGEINMDLKTELNIGGIASVNNGKILKSGSSIMYNGNTIANTVKIGGIAVVNNASVYDSYSTTSVSNDVVTNIKPEFGGLVHTNEATGEIKNSYFAGVNSSGFKTTKTTADGKQEVVNTSPVAVTANGAFKNVYYDAEAAPSEVAKTGITALSTRRLQLAKTETNAINLNPDNASVWKQNDLAENFSTNYGYPTIIGGCVIPTMAVVEVINEKERVHLYVSGESTVVPIFHAGMLNKLRTASGYNYVLYRNINLSKVNNAEASSYETVVGTLKPIDKLQKNFDGKKKTISNLKITTSGNSGVGLFSNFIDNASFKNVNFNGINIDVKSITNQETSGVGTVVGTLTKGVISNVILKDMMINASGINNVGGLVGRMLEGSINNVSLSTMASGVYGAGIKGKENVGGLIGNADSVKLASIDEITNNISISGTNKVGGIIGNISAGVSSFNNISNSNTVNGNQYVGGIVGYGSAITATGLRNTKDITGTQYVGGLFGSLSNSTVTAKNSLKEFTYNYGNIVGNHNLGGIAGVINSATFEGTGYTIRNTGNVGKNEVIESTYIGGVFGSMENGSKANNVTNTGNLWGYKYIGGFAGAMAGNSTLANSNITTKIMIHYRSAKDMDNNNGDVGSLLVGAGSNPLDYFGVGGGRKDWPNNRVYEYGGNEYDSAKNNSIGSNKYDLFIGFVSGVLKVSNTITNVLYTGEGAGSEILEIYDTYRNYYYSLNEFHYILPDAFKGNICIQENRRYFKMIYKDAMSSDVSKNLSRVNRDTYWYGSSNRNKADSFNQGSIKYDESSPVIKSNLDTSYSNGMYLVSKTDINDVYVRNSSYSDFYGYTYYAINRFGIEKNISSLSNYVTFQSVKTANYKQNYTYNGNNGKLTSATTLSKYYSGLNYDGEVYGVISSAGIGASKKDDGFNENNGSWFNRYDFASITIKPNKDLSYWGGNRNTSADFKGMNNI